MSGPLGDRKLLGLVGPTASGKTALSLALAEALGAEIVSVDSMLVYRGMDVGTAKPAVAERERVRHHLVDVAEPSEAYDVVRYVADVEACVEAAGDRPLLFVGGTGFYWRALTHGIFDGPPTSPELRAELERRAEEIGADALHAELVEVDPVAAQRIHPNDVRRVVRALEVERQTGRTLTDWQAQWREGPGMTGAARAGVDRVLFGLQVDPDVLESRIRERTRRMLDGGWIEEVRAIRDGAGFGPTAVQALGYPEVLRHLDGELDREELEATIALRTRQFARRQRTWFRKFPEIEWVPAPDSDDLDVDRWVERFSRPGTSTAS